MIHYELIEPYARAVVSALGIGILESAALAALVWGMIHLRPRPSATTRHVLWWVTLAASAVLPIVSIAASLGRVEHRVVTQWVSAPELRGAAHRAVVMPSLARSGSSASHTIAVATHDRSSDARRVTLGSLGDALLGAWRSAAALPFGGVALIGLWLFGAAAGGLSLGRSLFALRRIKAEASPLDEGVVRRLRRWRHSARTGRSVALAVSNDVDVPVAVGFRTPTILLPIQVVETEEIADVDQIAMHEYAHLNRLDDWTNLIQRVIERLFWFNPVVQVVGRRISLEREIACDDWVVAQTGRAHRYATCLWKLVEASRLPAKRIMAPGALLSPRQITIRIEQLLDARRNALPRLSPLGALAVGVLCIGLIVVQAQRAPSVAITEVREAPLGAQSASTATRAALPNPTRARSESTAAPVVERRSTHVIDAAPRANTTSQTATAAVTHAAEPPIKRLPSATRVVTVFSPIQNPHRANPHPANPHPAALAALPGGAVSTTLGEQAPAFWSQFGTELRTKLDLHLNRALRATGPEIAASIARGLASVPDPAASPFGQLKELRVAANDSRSSGVPLDRTILSRCMGCDLAGVDLHGLDLHGISLTGVDLAGADLRGANLSGARLSGVNLRGAKLDGANLSNARLSGCELRDVSLKNVQIDGLMLAGMNLRGIDLTGFAHLRVLIEHCSGCDLRGFDLHGQDLRGLHVSGADMVGINLRGALLNDAVFEGVDLRHADLTGADLRNAKLRGCNMRGADFTNANLSGVSLEGSDLTIDGASHMHGTPHDGQASSDSDASFEAGAGVESVAYAVAPPASAPATSSTAASREASSLVEKHCPHRT